LRSERRKPPGRHTKIIFRIDRYYETIVDYEDVGPVRLYFAKGSHQRHWKLFLSTDTRLNFNKFVEIYSIRWGIEVIFKECKSYLRIGKCQARSFTSQIASLTICYILYNMLVRDKKEPVPLHEGNGLFLSGAVIIC